MARSPRPQRPPRHTPHQPLKPSLAPTTTPTPLPRWAPLAFIAVALAALLAYLPTLANDWTSWDDPQNFLNNPNFRGLGVEQIRWMLTQFWMGHYQPLSWLTLGLDYTLWGMNPLGYHLTNIVLHAVSTGLFGLLAARLFLVGKSGAHGAASARSAVVFGVLAALVWALHPLRVEAVSWATQRREVLCAVFTLLTLNNSAKGGRHWLTHLFAIAAMGSKATAVPLPAMLVLIDAWRAHAVWRGGGGDLFRLVPIVGRSLVRHRLIFAAAIAFTLIAFAAQEASDSRIPWDWLPLSDRLVLYFYDLGFYIQKTFWPWPLAPLYEGPRDWVSGAPGPGGRVSAVSELIPFAAVSSVIVLAALAAALALRKRMPGLLLLLVAYLGMVIPVGGFGQSGPQIAADRYTYQPAWALSLLLVAGVWLVVSRLGVRKPVVIGAIAVAAIALAACTAVTVTLERTWRDAETFWQHTVRYFPNTARAHFNLGYLAVNRTPPDDATAEPHFRAAIAKIPEYADCLCLLGDLLVRTSRPQEAAQRYAEALRTIPGHPPSLARLPDLLWQIDRREEAVRLFAELQKANPASPEAQWKLARALAAAGHPREAVQVYRAGVATFPMHVPLLTDYAWLLATHPDASIRDGQKALDIARRARAAAPDDLRSYFTLIAALAESGQFDQAQAELEKTLSAVPPESSGPLRSLLDQVKRHEPIRTPPVYP